MANILNGPFIRSNGEFRFNGYVKPIKQEDMSEGNNNGLVIYHVESGCEVYVDYVVKYGEKSRAWLNLTTSLDLEKNGNKKETEKRARALSECVVRELEDLAALQILNRHRHK